MQSRTFRVLLIEDDGDDASLVREELNQSAPEVTLIHAERLSEALRLLQANAMDVILLDLMLPDSRGLETLAHLLEHSSNTPIVVMTGMNQHELALNAVREGAQDYLVKGQVNGTQLMRALFFAVERQRVQSNLRGLLLLDELTGLYNRRGFMLLGTELLQVGKRMNKGSVLFFADVDQLKQINDSYGHAQGDQALFDCGELLRASFRETEIIARYGGDEFVVLAQTPRNAVDNMELRLRERIHRHNERAQRPYRFSLSIGYAYRDVVSDESLDALLLRADQAMYDQKYEHKQD